MATYKAEFLSHHYKRRLRPMAAYSMGLIMLHARLAQQRRGSPTCSPTRRASAAWSSAPAGSAASARMPPFADQTFKAWWEGRGAVNPNADPVVLFPDTFNNFLHPEPMKAAVRVLEDAGFRVVVPAPALCCGRPLYDYGMLDTAKLFWRRMLDALAPHIHDGSRWSGSSRAASPPSATSCPT